MINRKQSASHIKQSSKVRGYIHSQFWETLLSCPLERHLASSLMQHTPYTIVENSHTKVWNLHSIHIDIVRRIVLSVQNLIEWVYLSLLCLKQYSVILDQLIQACLLHFDVVIAILCTISCYIWQWYMTGPNFIASFYILGSSEKSYDCLCHV